MDTRSFRLKVFLPSEEQTHPSLQFTGTAGNAVLPAQAEGSECGMMCVCSNLERLKGPSTSPKKKKRWVGERTVSSRRIHPQLHTFGAPLGWRRISRAALNLLNTPYPSQKIASYLQHVSLTLWPLSHSTLLVVSVHGPAPGLWSTWLVLLHKFVRSSYP